jgi:UDP-N-acetyl-alpha-D-muramoyl-L-alanyl-L-glutamate epimerase
MTSDPLPDSAFEYVGYRIEPAQNRVDCHYRLGQRDFHESYVFPGGGDWDASAVEAAARLLFLLAGVSYYKTAAPRVIDLGSTALTADERSFLRQYYLEGLGEFAYRNGLDLSALQLVAPELDRPARSGSAAGSADGSADAATEPARPLVPFGGGLDSIVSVELLRQRGVDSALFIVNRPGDRFDAIEEPARVTGLPIVRADRLIDEQVLRSRELGFRNGHVPVTAIISAAAVLAAALEGRDAVVMSNEWSASSATLVVDGREINHQYSKSDDFETALRAFLRSADPGLPDYFSLLRPFSELWIAERFVEHPEYLLHFRSCNRAFHIDRALRFDHWCGECDKCCFIDLVLAPFVAREDLELVFRGAEPLANPERLPTFRRLLALLPDSKPWECVGDEVECRVAARLAARRPDRAGNQVLRQLVDESAGRHDPDADHLLRPLASHHVPDRYAPDALLV